MSQRTDPQKHREQVQAANRARHRATKRLIEKHRDEWDALYAHEAEKEGVTPKPREKVDVASIHAEIAALRTKLDGVVKPKQGRGTRR